MVRTHRGGSGIVKKLRLVRVAQGYPAYKFAAMIGIHPNFLREIELGVREPSARVKLEACNILRKPPDELFADASDALVK